VVGTVAHHLGRGHNRPVDLAPALGPVIGVDISGDLVRQAGEDVLSVVQVLSTLAGTLMTIVGRARAAQPLERRQVSIRL
jgi:hypothetical protein